MGDKNRMNIGSSRFPRNVPMKETKELQAVVQANDVFTKLLYNILAKQEGNVFFSPIGVHAVLSMAFQGAKKSTIKALAEALSISDTNLAAEGYATIMEDFNNVTDVELSTINKIYIMEGFTLKRKFMEIVQKKFLSDVEAINFRDASNAAKIINDWVEEQTKNKIKELISSDMLNAETRLVLINAIYFKGTWEYKFDAKLTTTDTFYLNSLESIDVQMMTNSGLYSYKEDNHLNAKVLELYYSNRNVSLIIILPDDKDGIAKLEKKLKHTDLTKITKGLSDTYDVTVKLPKFKIETTLTLNEPLVKLGLENIFNENKANFSDMLKNPSQLHVSKVIQKVSMEVHEEGISDPPPPSTVLLLTLLLITHPAMAGKQELQAVVQGNGIFTKQLYNILAKKDGNVFFSPISAHAVLSMAFQGSKGTTYEAFTKALHVTDAKLAADGYRDVIGHLNNVPNVELSMANRIYIMDGFSLKPEFKEVTQKKFLSEVEAVNFGDSVNAAKNINSWVEDKTKNKIKDLIKPDMLNSLTRLVLVNAIYFKGNWATKFDARLTKTDKFYINNNDSIDVQMMENKGKYFYKEDENLDAKVLELPYSNPDVSLLVILPNKRDGIADLEKKLADTDLTKITENMYKPEVIVKLPKFKIETTIELNEPLAELGLGVIFDERNANFSDMLASPEQLVVSKVIQKAFIEVNEEGTEAAAATGLIRSRRALELPEEFLADRPFICLLSHGEKSFGKHVLFYGKVLKPPSVGDTSVVHEEL